MPIAAANNFWQEHGLIAGYATSAFDAKWQAREICAGDVKHLQTLRILAD